MNNRLMYWTGGKLRVAYIIASLIPEEAEAYYEPFIGSGAVLINKYRHPLEVINDKDKNLATLHQVIADRHKGKQLMEKLFRQGSQKRDFLEAKNLLKYNAGNLDDVERARCEFVKISLSFNGLGGTYHTVNQWQFTKDVHYQLPIIYERYQGVRVHCGCGIAMTQKVVGNKKAFVFLDPPYVHTLRGNTSIYQCEMPLPLQRKMLEVIKSAECKIMLCGYVNKKGKNLYDNELLPYGWKRYKLAELVQSCQYKKGESKDVGEEYIWVNYELPPFAKYYISLSSEVSRNEYNNM